MHLLMISSALLMSFCKWLISAFVLYNHLYPNYILLFLKLYTLFINHLHYLCSLSHNNYINRYAVQILIKEHLHKVKKIET